MKRCLHCGAVFATPGWGCAACGAVPREIGGYRAFAPDLAVTNDGMDPQAHHRLDKIQATSFWFRARNRLIVDLSIRYFPGAQSLLEVGCGTGYVLHGLQQERPRLRLAGSEIYANGLDYARQRLGPHVELFQMDARAIPFVDEFDLIGAFDVLEHIEEDREVLRAMRQALRPGGGLLLSVPQHPFLWSRVDEIAYHKRRYRRNELEQKCRAAGFEVLRTTSFVCTLLPLMLAQRLVHGCSKNYDPDAEMALPARLNQAFEVMLDLERRAIDAGLSFPVGGSRFVVARRPQ